MSFEIGQTVVYPHHGAATIEEVMTRTIRGEERTYLKLRVNQGDLEIQVPAENVDMVGVRDIVDEDGLEEVLSVLRAPYIEEPTNWSRRFKANQEKIATGRMEKFYKEQCLTEQEFVKDSDQTIASYTAAVAKQLGGSIKVTGFKRFTLGETA